MGVQTYQQLSWTDGIYLIVPPFAMTIQPKTLIPVGILKFYSHEKILCTHVGVNDHLINSDEYIQQ